MNGPEVEELLLAGTVLEEQLFAGRSFIHRQDRCMTLKNHG